MFQKTQHLFSTLSITPLENRLEPESTKTSNKGTSHHQTEYLQFVQGRLPVGEEATYPQGLPFNLHFTRSPILNC